MKNIFKFLSIALVAGAMMVACEKDPENGTTDTTGNTPVNPQPQPQERGVNVTFGSETWTAGDVTAIYGTVQAGWSAFQVTAYKETGALPAFMLLSKLEQGSQTVNAIIETVSDTTYGDYTAVTGYDNEYVNLQYYDSQEALQYTQGQRGDYGMLNATVNVTAYDATAMTLTANVTAQMWNWFSWYTGEVLNVEDAATKNLTINIVGVELAAAGK